MSSRNEDLEDEWLREQIAEFLKRGWSMDDLASVGITRDLLVRLGLRDDHPHLFDEPQPSVPPPAANDKAASRSSRDAALFC